MRLCKQEIWIITFLKQPKKKTPRCIHYRLSQLSFTRDFSSAVYIKHVNYKNRTFSYILSLYFNHYIPTFLKKTPRTTASYRDQQNTTSYSACSICQTVCSYINIYHNVPCPRNTRQEPSCIHLNEPLDHPLPPPTYCVETNANNLS